MRKNNYETAHSNPIAKTRKGTHQDAAAVAQKLVLRREYRAPRADWGAFKALGGLTRGKHLPEFSGSIANDRN